MHRYQYQCYNQCQKEGTNINAITNAKEKNIKCMETIFGSLEYSCLITEAYWDHINTSFF